MSDTTPALDEAFERMAAASFELPNGFVNHGAMACEALAVLDCTDDIDSWARRFARAGGASVDPVVPAGFEWRQALGDYYRLPEWIGYFTQAIDDDGWPTVVATWVPRLMPALRTALFHGVIRTAHAVRAVDAVDTPPRRGELARALGYWATRYRAGQPASPLPHAGDLRMAVVRAAADGARRYLARPDIFHLHGVTGAMAVEILAAHIPAADGATALAHVLAEHAALYAATEPVTQPHPASPPGSERVQRRCDECVPERVRPGWLGDPRAGATRRTIRAAPRRSSRRPSGARSTGPSHRSPTARSIARAAQLKQAHMALLAAASELPEVQA